MKKGILIIVMIILMSFSTYAIPQVISQCPITMTNDTEYIMTENFNFNKANCFDFTGINLQNIVIDGNGSVYSDPSSITRFIQIGGGNLVLEGLEVKNITILDMGTAYFMEFQTDDTDYVENFDVHDNAILKSTSTGGFISFGERTSSGDNTRAYNGSFIIENNYYEGYRAFIILETLDAGSATGIHQFGSMVIRYNDIIHGGAIAYGTTGIVIGRGATANVFRWQMSGQWVFENNNAVGDGQLFASEPYLYGSYSFSSNFDGSMSSSLDAVSPFGTTDSAITRISSNSITYSNQVESTASYSKSGHSQNAKEAYISVPWNTPWVNIVANLAGSGYSGFNGYHVFLSQDMTLDGSTNVIYFEGFYDSTLDISNLARTTGLTLTNTRVLRMGTNNILYGGDNPTYRTDITTSGTISIFDSGYYGNNWNLIEYDNGLEIYHVQFNMNAPDNYGILRKRDGSADGINLVFEDNYVDFNFVPTNPDRPQFVFGALATFSENEFDLPSAVNLSLMGGGFSTGVGGGHVIVDNEFNGGGHIFASLQDGFAGTNYPSKFVHNSFNQVGSLYAQPFDPNEDTNNLLDSPLLNGSYFYKTTCTHYEFNVGNWYEDWRDSGFYNDTNGDGIHDEFLGIAYIERGADFNGDPIRDYRSVTPYPYDFASNIGTLSSEKVYDICALFNYNIVSPTEQNYTSGYSLTTNWEYVATGYPSMYCMETLNGETSIFEDVSTGANNGVTYETTDGAGAFQVTCCDTVQCDNIVKESEVIDFCIGDCSASLVVINTSIPIVSILGCTDSEATNYNPSATQDDGSCTYDGDGDGDDDGGVGVGGITPTGLFSTDYGESADNLVGLFGLLETPFGIMILIGFMAIFVGIFVLIFSVVGALVHKR